MNSPVHDNDDDEDDQGEVFLDESDIIQEVTVDDQDLPDVEEYDLGSDAEPEPDDSVHIFTSHTDELYTVACSPADATLVATGGGDDKGFLWRINRGDWASEIQGHKDSVSSLAFSTDGQLLASGGFDGLVQIWDTSSGNLKCALDGPGGGIEWVSWHPRGHVILAGSEDSSVWMWNADRGAYLNMFSGHGSSVTCGDFTPDGKTICTGSDDATMRIWNPKSGENIHVVTDVLAAAQAAAETAEHAAAAARSAASLAQIRISKLTQKRNDAVSESGCENPFHKGEPDQSTKTKKPHLDHQNPSNDPGRMFKSPDSQQLYEDYRRSELPDVPAFDKLKEDFDSSPSNDHVYDQELVEHHQPQRLTSMEDDSHFSYPNLFTSQNSNLGSGAQSSIDNTRSTHEV